MPKELKGVAEAMRRGPGPAVAPHMMAPKAQIVRPGQYRSGENREGTPAGGEHTEARMQRYKDGADHRASLRDSRK